MFKLETKRLIIRNMQLSDEDAFVAISQDPSYQRFYDDADCAPQKYRQLTKLFVKQASEQPRLNYQLAIESKASGTFIGTVCLRLEAEHQASFGAGLSVTEQAKGLMLEAASALIDFGFTHLSLQRIYAETIAQNDSAIKLCLALGMHQETRINQARYFKQQYWDEVVLAVHQLDWTTPTTITQSTKGLT